MKRFEWWHSVAVRRFGVLNVVAIALGAWLCADALHTEVSADWLDLFAAGDPVFKAYLTSGAATAGSQYVYVRMSGRDAPGGVPPDALRELDRVTEVLPVPLAVGDSDARWFRVGLQVEPPLSSVERRVVAGKVRDAVLLVDPAARFTGSDIVLDEFTHSVMSDFVRTSAVALILVAAVVVVFGRSVVVILGFGYQLLGLLASLVICRRIGVAMNMLSVALPCVLVGLGIDFVIHIVAASSGEHSTANSRQGLLAYVRVARPMFWGAVTTGIAFFSLCLAELPGLRAVGMLGGLSMLLMFASVSLLLPPAISRLGVGRRGTGDVSPFITRVIPSRPGVRRGVALGVGLACLLAAAYIPRVRVEDRVENLYDPDMPSLRLQGELAEASGVYPSLLFLSFESGNRPRILSELRDGVDGAVLAGVSTHSGRTTVAFLSRENPFDGRVRASLSERLASVVTNSGGVSPRVTGDAVLCSHMNDLIVDGMARAFVVVAGILALVLVVAFRRVRYVVGPLVALGLSAVGVLGLLGLFGVRLSAYNLTLFPLFVGIGVDDCLYVCHMSAGASSFRESPHVLRGVTLTTLTTLMGYGALILAGNLGFRAMGITALVGLSLTYLTAVFVLPALLRSV